MSEPLRILILEDNPADAELIQFELQEAGLSFTAKVVVTEKDFVCGIREFCPDLILSDYDLPTYNGALALAEAKRRCPDTPFILVTGAVTEDRAIDILTQGAKDYVLKTRLEQRLVPAVKRALAEAEEHRARKQTEAELREAHRTLTEANESLKAEIAERRRIEEELQRATQILRAISQYSPDLVYAKDTHCRLVYASESTLRVLGKSAQEVMGKNDVEFHADPRLGNAVMENDRIVRETRRPLVAEEPTRMPDGTVRVFHSTKVPWIAEDGMLMGTFGISVDIHELKQAEEALKAANETLEQRVAERVTELEAEVAARKKTEEELRIAERRYSALFANKINGMAHCRIITDEHGRPVDYCILQINDAYERIIGIKKADIEGRRVKEVFPGIENYAFDYIGAYGKIALEGGEIKFEEFFEATRQYLSIYAYSPLPGEFAAIFTDVTERKKAEEALRESESKYRNLFENMTEEVHFWKLVRNETGQIRTWKLIDANPPTLKTWGRNTIEEIRGKTTDEIFGPGATEHYRPIVEKIMTEGVPHSFEDYFSHLDKHFRFTSVPLGEYFITTGADITSIRKAELAVRESEERFRALTETSSLAVGVSSSDGKFLYINKAYEKLYGYTQKELNHLNASELWVNPEDRLKMIDAVRSKGFLMDYEVELKRKDGTPFWAMLSVNSVDYGGSQAIMASVYDITERKRAEEALKQQSDRLEDANKDLESFSYSVSHDLRAPLRTINGYLQMILKNEGARFDDETRRRFQMITDNTKKMDHLIDDLLALSLLGSQAVTKKSFNMEQLVSDVWSELRAMHSDRKMTLKNGPMPVAWGDRSLIWQVYSNLLDNAVKFTIERECALIETGGFVQNGEMIYCVRDNGIGFDMKFHDKLFGVFQRLHDDEAYKGTGIGLALVKRIINRHGGRVWAEGTVDKGATFCFTLPTPQK